MDDQLLVEEHFFEFFFFFFFLAISWSQKEVLNKFKTHFFKKNLIEILSWNNN